MERIYSFFGKKLKLDAKYVLQGGAWLTAQRFISISTSMLAAYVFANYIEPETFGKYKYVISAAGLLAAFSLSGATSSLKLSAARDFDKTLDSAYFYSLKWSVLIFSGALGASFYYFYNDDSILGYGMLLVAFFKPLMSAGGLHMSFLEGKTEFVVKAITASVQTLISTLSVVIAVFLTENILIILLTYFVSHTLTQNILFLYTRHRFIKNFSEDISFLSYAKHLSLMSVLSKISMQLDKILIFQSISGTSLAIYSFAATPVNELTEINATLKKLIFPKLATRNIDEIKEKLPAKLFFVFIFSVLLYLAYFISAPYIFSILFPQYLGAVAISQFMALSVLTFVKMPLNTTLIVQKATRQLYIINTTSPILRITLFLLLVPLFGIWGAAYSLVITDVVQAIQIFYFYKKL